MTLSVTYAGSAGSFTLPSSSLLSDLQTLLSTHFDVPPHAQKLITKGAKLTDPSAPLATLVRTGAKLVLVGAKRVDVDALRQEEETRRRKKSAFEYHAQHKHAPVRSTKVVELESDEAYCFHSIVPFPPEVPCEDVRKKMLERLAGDEAVRDVMKRHRYQVGVLNELHPLLQVRLDLRHSLLSLAQTGIPRIRSSADSPLSTQPTLLGLNKNAGEEISLRLLTNDLEGTRAYLDVRKVLLHELAHNVHSDQYVPLFPPPLPSLTPRTATQPSTSSTRFSTRKWRRTSSHEGSGMVVRRRRGHQLRERRSSCGPRTR